MAALPSGDDLKRIPLRGLIALAARCALRVQPLYWVDEKHSEAEECFAVVDDAIRMALDFAAGKETDPDKATSIEDAVVRAVVVASGEERSDRRAAFSSNAAYAAINAVTSAMASKTAGSRTTEAMRSVIAVVTSIDASIAADPATRHAVITDFARLSRMSLGSFPNFGKAVNMTGKGILGSVNQSRLNATSSPGLNEEKNNEHRQTLQEEHSQTLQELESLREAIKADRADLAEQRRVAAGAESKLATEREELDRRREQIAKLAKEVETEREELQDERGQLALARNLRRTPAPCFQFEQPPQEETEEDVVVSRLPKAVHQPRARSESLKVRDGGRRETTCFERSPTT